MLEIEAVIILPGWKFSGQSWGDLSLFCTDSLKFMGFRSPVWKINLTEMLDVFNLWTDTNGWGEPPTPCGSLRGVFYIIFMNQELSIKIIRELEKAPEQSQRELSKRCGVSLGSAHYCINALVIKGYVKARNFKNAQNKLAMLIF